MRRILFPGLVVFCLFLLPSGPTSAQQTQKKRMAAINWEILPEDIQVLRVWQLDGKQDTYPQIAVLRVSNGTYLKFFQDRDGFKTFINNNQVFPKPVNQVLAWVSLSSVVSVPEDPSPTWVLTCVHGKTSLSACSALPQLSAEPPAPKPK